MRITNTRDQVFNQHPFLTLISGAASPSGIEAQESQGQGELAASSQLPAKGIHEVEPMGVKIIGLSLGDELFVDVELPTGWSIQPTDHSMWSHLVDEKGRKRAGIFYKAAFYDRKAHIDANRRYYATNQPVGGYRESEYDPETPYEGVVKDSGLDQVVWTSPPFAYDPTVPYQCHDDARKAAEAWLEANYPDHKNVAAYWD